MHTDSFLPVQVTHERQASSSGIHLMVKGMQRRRDVEQTLQHLISHMALLAMASASTPANSVVVCASLKEQAGATEDWPSALRDELLKVYSSLPVEMDIIRQGQHVPGGPTHAHYCFM